jgi:hypothetical protein
MLGLEIPGMLDLEIPTELRQATNHSAGVFEHLSGNSMALPCREGLVGLFGN